MSRPFGRLSLFKRMRGDTMAVYKTVRHIMDENGTYHTVHEETGADQVKCEDGTTAQEHIANTDIHVSETDRESWKPFQAEYGVTTYDEIKTAYDAGRMVLCPYSTYIFLLENLTPAIASFRRADSGSLIHLVCSKATGEWSQGAYKYVPGAHAATHASDGSDPITPESIGAKSASDSDVFIATYGTTTSAEIAEARAAGKACFCKNGTYIAPLTWYFQNVRHWFCVADGNYITKYECIGNNWTTETIGYTPATHASTHASGGSDPITPESIGAAPAYTYGTEDLVAGTSPLETGKLYFVYE